VVDADHSASKPLSATRQTEKVVSTDQERLRLRTSPTQPSISHVTIAPPHPASSHLEPLKSNRHRHSRHRPPASSSPIGRASNPRLRGHRASVQSRFPPVPRRLNARTADARRTLNHSTTTRQLPQYGLNGISFAPASFCRTQRAVEAVLSRNVVTVANGFMGGASLSVPRFQSLIREL